MQCSESLLSHGAFGNADLFLLLAPFVAPQTLYVLSSANWLMESMVRRSTAPLRLRLAMGEFLAMWGGIEQVQRQMGGNGQGVQKWLAFVGRNDLIRHFGDELCYVIGFLADTLQTWWFERRYHPKLKQQLWLPLAGILWQDERKEEPDQHDVLVLHDTDEVIRRKESRRLFWRERLKARSNDRFWRKSAR